MLKHGFIVLFSVFIQISAYIEKISIAGCVKMKNITLPTKPLGLVIKAKVAKN